MALNDIIRSGVKIADNVTKGTQVTVTHRAFTGQDGEGASSYSAPASRKAIVDLTRKLRPRQDGTMVPIVATVILLEVIAPNGAVTDPPRQEPIDPRDILTLPNGLTGPIMMAPDAVLDPATNRPYFNQVYIGEV